MPTQEELEAAKTEAYAQANRLPTDMFGKNLRAEAIAKIDAQFDAFREDDIENLIYQNMTEANEMQDLLMPYMLEEMGFSMVEGEDGTKSLERVPWEERIANLSPQEQKQLQNQDALMNQQLVGSGINPDTGVMFASDEERFSFMTPEQQSLYELNKEAMDMELKAMRGELDISPGLERDLAKSKGLLLEDMARKGQVGGTAEAQRLGTWEEMSNITRESARHGLMSTSEGLRSSISGDMFRDKAYAGDAYGASNYLTRSGSSARTGLMSAIPQQYSSMVGTGVNALQPYQFNKQLQSGIDAQNAANAAGKRAGLMQLAGTVGTAGAIYAASSKDFKEDIKPIGKKGESEALSMVKDGNTYTYNYKKGMGPKGKRIGLVTEDAPREVVSPDGKFLDIPQEVGLLRTATKALAKKVDKMEKKKKKRRAA